MASIDQMYTLYPGVKVNIEGFSNDITWSFVGTAAHTEVGQSVYIFHLDGNTHHFHEIIKPEDVYKVTILNKDGTPWVETPIEDDED